MIEFASFSAAVFPILIYLLILWKFDSYNREPLRYVLMNFFWGCIGAVVFTLLISSFFNFFASIIIQDKKTLDEIDTIVFAPTIEESVKGVFLLVFIFSKEMKNTTEGIIYGGAIGLGFGMTENLLYFLANTQNIYSWMALVIIRTLFSAIMHCVATAAFGASIGYAKFKGGAIGFIAPFLGIAIAIFIHFFWNLTVSFNSTYWLGLAFVGVNIIIFLVLYTGAISNEKKIIYNELIEEAYSGLIPFSHVDILTSSRRNLKGWFNEYYKDFYIKTAVTLAMRKAQVRNSAGYKRNKYLNEVENCRDIIRNLFHNLN